MVLATKDIKGAYVSDEGVGPRRGYSDSSSSARARRTWRRRKRTVIGKEWTPPGLQDVSGGVWCKHCHMRHPYNGKNKVVLDYDLYQGKFTLLWLCPASGEVIGELRKKELWDY